VQYRPVGVSAGDLLVMRLIDEQYLRHPEYGSPRMTDWLHAQGEVANHKRVERLMRLMGLQAITPGPHTSKPAPGHKIYPYLLRNVDIERVHQVWSMDITYIPMKRGYMYLAAVIEWCSRYVLSWQLSNTMDSSFCVDALRAALGQGRPEIFNTDQGLPVHEWRLHRRATDQADSHQHGWPGTRLGQCLHREALVDREI